MKTKYLGKKKNELTKSFLYYVFCLTKLEDAISSMFLSIILCCFIPYTIINYQLPTTQPSVPLRTASPCHLKPQTQPWRYTLPCEYSFWWNLWSLYCSVHTRKRDVRHCKDLYGRWLEAISCWVKIEVCGCIFTTTQIIYNEKIIIFTNILKLTKLFQL